MATTWVGDDVGVHCLFYILYTIHVMCKIFMRMLMFTQAAILHVSTTMETSLRTSPSSPPPPPLYLVWRNVVVAALKFTQQIILNDGIQVCGTLFHIICAVDDGEA